MSYGIVGYLTSISDMEKIWGSKISITRSQFTSDMKAMLGYTFMAKQSATNWLKSSNKHIKKECGYPDFRSHRAMQDIFDGELSYPNAPFIYTTLLQTIAHEIAENYYFKILKEYKTAHPYAGLGRPDQPYWDRVREHMYDRILLRTGMKLCSVPNDQWYPCDLSIIKYLPENIPIPIPSPDDFPYISAIPHKDLSTVLNGIDFTGYSSAAIEQMKLWFEKADKEQRDLIFFIY